MNNPTYSKSTQQVQCPGCKCEFTVGLIASNPVIEWALTNEALAIGKTRFLSAVLESSLGDDQKRALNEQYADPSVVIDPELLSAMIEEIRRTYPPATKVVINEPPKGYPLPTDFKTIQEVKIKKPKKST